WPSGTHETKRRHGYLVWRSYHYFSESLPSHPASKRTIRGLQKMVGAIFSDKSTPELLVWRPLHFVSAPNPHPLPSNVVREDEPLLVASARAGDAAAFEELVARYEDKIFRLTSNITGNREDAEDAMQDAFLKAYAHLCDFHGESRFYTWLVRIAANE